MTSSSTHENSLDWLRIAAASAVLVHHLSPFVLGRSAIPHGYLAVDLFFLISGFVVSRRFAAGLLSGELAIRMFLRARISRLVPLLLLAGIVCAIEAGLRKRFGVTLADVSISRIVATIAWTCLALPTVQTPSLGLGNWPLNPPLWSLFHELLVGVLLAPFLIRASSRLLAVLVVLAAAALLAFGLAGVDINGGVFLREAPVAFLRIAFSFNLGILLHRGLAQGRALPDGWLRLGTVAAIAVGVALLVTGPDQAIAVDLLTIFVLWPVVVCHAVSPAARRMPRALLLGELSYAIYVLHWPAMFLLRNLARHAGARGVDTPPGISLIGACIVALSVVAVLLWERPMRKMLNRRADGSGDAGRQRPPTSPP